MEAVTSAEVPVTGGGEDGPAVVVPEEMQTEAVGGADTVTSEPSKVEDIKNGKEGPAEAQAPEETNPYAYLNRDEFSSERFKIEVSGLPKYHGFSELRKLFNDKLKVNAHKLIPPMKGCFHMFVNFKSEEERQLAIQKIDGYVWKNRTLSAKFAKPAEDPLIKKRMNEEMDNVESGFAPKETVAEIIRRVTTPWWNVPYDEQLVRKTKMISEVFTEMKNGILQVQKHLKSSLLSEDMVEKIRPSPVIKHYRNKSEFSIGFSPDTGEKTVGFRVSSYKKGSVAVGSIETVDHLPECMVKYALQFQDFIRQSKYAVYDPETHQGCYRQLTVRSTRTDDLLMMVALNNKELTTEEYDNLKEDLKSKFSPENAPSIKSFYIKFLNDHGHPDNNPPELLFGTETITETVLGLKFDVSPEAFFQVNIPATEILYSAIGDILGDQKDATLLDVCSGTGTIGISVSSKCSQVLGIEMVASAVVDARKNAEINGLSDKCDFFAGKAEDITEPVIVRAKSNNIIAVVDPPRAGLHQKVLFTLRRCDKIETLIYVACNAKAAMKNFIDLCRPASNSFKGKSFIPVKLIPVDMFPNSPHVELIIVFKRLDTVLNDN